MNSRRKAAQDLCLEFIEKIAPGSPNTDLYKKKFAAMTDEQFDEFIAQLKTKQVRLSFVVPNFAKYSVSFERNLAIMAELGHNPFVRIWVPATEHHPKYLSNNPQLVLDMPARRQAQMVDHKLSVPEDNGSVDDYTGQPTGRSKSTTVTYPEAQVLAGRGRPAMLTELLKWRGGDQKGFAAMNTIIARTGGVSQQALLPYASGVKSSKTLATIFKGMHIKTEGL